AKVYCNKNDAKLVKGFKAESSDITGGLIAENADGTVRVDYSFDTMLQNVKENELQKISKILFG
ncbi:MAG: V-type ATP synthase subunit E family protein, partial [Nanoarchaeota archaeon]